MKIGIYFGSNTGNTKKAAYLIYKEISSFYKSKLFNIAKVDSSEFKKTDVFILGTSTWYDGELQDDWENFLPILDKISFKKKIVAFFGCGDQENYGNTFCNGISKLFDIVKKNGAIIIGYWSIYGYKFLNSNSLLNKNYFLGLILDENNQSMLTNNRINTWVNKLILKINKIKRN